MGTLGEKIPTLPHRAREGWGTRFDATFRKCRFGRKSRLKIRTNVAKDARFGWGTRHDNGKAGPSLRSG
jgi:hypothetical protein